MDFSATSLLDAVSSHTAYVVTDLDGLILDANALFLSLSEYSLEDLIGTTGMLFNSCEHGSDFWQDFWLGLNREKMWKGKLRGRRKSGERYWVEATVSVKSSTELGLDRCLCLLTDISELVRLQKRVSSMRDMNTEVARVAKVGSWELLMSDLKPRWSALTREIHEVEPGYEPTLEDGIKFYKEGDDREKIRRLVEETMVDGGRWDEEFRIITGKQREIWVRAVGEAEVVDGKCVRLFGTFQDIDDRKRAQLESQRANEIMHGVLNTAKDFVIVASDLDGIITAFNSGAAVQLGYTTEEVIGKARPSLFHDRDEVQARAEELSRELGRKVEGFETFVAVPKLKGSETREWMCIRKDGTRFPISLVVRPVKDSKGVTTGFLGIAIDISEKKLADAELKERETLLKKAKERLALATKAGGVGIWDHNLRDGNLAWDEQMFELFGVDESMFKSGFEVWQQKLHPDDKERVLSETRRAIEEAEPYNTEYRIRRSPGEIRFLRSFAHVYHDTDGNPIRMVGTNWDVTEQANQRERLIALAAEAKQASRAKTNFLANMSHEIRTPLNGIIGMTSLLLDSDNLEEDTRHSIEIVLSSSQTLLSLINDILDFSKVEAGKTELEEVAFDLRETLHDFACLISIKADDKDLQFDCSVGPKLPAMLIGDPARLRQVLVNLTGNAIKFTEHGSVNVVANVHELNGEEVVLKFTITDTGVGIAQEQQMALFGRFTQADTSVTRKFGGTGLGLAISKHLTELMGGRIGLASEEGKGSEFWFTAKFRVMQLNKDKSDAPKVQGARIIVASANTSLRRELRELLTLWRVDVVETQGKETLRQLKPETGFTERIDAVILDYELDGVDADSVARSIREDKELNTTAIVMLRSLGRRRRGDKGLDICDASLFRPPSPSKLFDSLAKLLNREEIEAVSKKDVKSELVLHSIQRILLVEDNPINQVVVQTMLKRLDLKADVAANGFEALNLLELLDYDLILMDVQMPEMDGLEATRRIRALSNAKMCKVPIIAMTAHAREEDRQQCLLAGMSDYMSKPITFTGLAQMLDKWQADVQVADANT